MPGPNRWKPLLVLSAVALALHAPIPGLTDPDSLYHIRHAWIYRTGGMWQSAFPWIQFSAIEREGSNLWYGFHVLLVPFTFGTDLLAGIRVAGVLITIASLMLAWAALAHLRVRFPLLCTLVFAFLTADSLFRLTMVRPHPLSLGIALCLFALLCGDRPHRWAVLLLAAAFAWIHLSLAWLPAFLWVATAGARLLRKRRPPWIAGLFLAAGLAVGAFARPNPIGGFRLASIQVVTWLAEKGATVLLHVGRELRPFEWRHFTDQLVPATLFAASAAVLFLVRRPAPAGGPARAGDDRLAVAGWASLVLCAGFFAMCFMVAKRAIDPFVGFATILAACSAEPWIAAATQARSLVKAAPLAPLALTAVATPFWSVAYYRTYLQSAANTGSERMREPATWIRDHARPGDIVFNVNWDAFASLFFWSPGTYCVSGNDPVFLYARDPELYWISRQLESDALIVDGGRGYVCAAPPCPSEQLEDVHTAIAGRFRASFVVLQKWRTPRLGAYLAQDPRFELAFQTGKEAVFRVVR